MRRAGSVVIALMVASCGSTDDATESAGAVEMIELDEDGDLVSPLDGSRDASLLAALDVRTGGCGPRVGIGSASLIADGVAITAAHVVAGADVVTVIDLDLIEHVASVVDIDPDLDVALLRVPDGVGYPLGFLDGRVEVGDVGAVSVAREFTETGDVITLDVDVLRRANVSTTDIYLDREVVRPGFEIAASIEPGDSGAAVVIAGQAAGVVWSRSIERDGRAWIVNIPDSYRDPAIRRALVDPVDTGDCP